MYSRGQEFLKLWRKLTRDQKTLVYKVFDFGIFEYLDTAESTLENIVLVCLRESLSLGRSPSISFRGARYLTNKSKMQAVDNISPYLTYLFQDVGESRLKKAFADLTVSESAEIRKFFAENWYIYQYTDVEQAGIDAFVHFMTDGWREGRDPSPDFSTSGYLHRYREIADAAINPLQHWVHHGRKEGRTTSAQVVEYDSSQYAVFHKLFDPRFYKETSGSDKESDGDLLGEYLQLGWKQGYNPTRSFNGRLYATLNCTRLDPFAHYLFETCGMLRLNSFLEILSASDVAIIRNEFNDSWYSYCYPDVARSGCDLFIHYMCVGWHERRDPSPDFCTSAYLYRYPDIARSMMNPFHHWVLHGEEEGRFGASTTHSIRNRPYLPLVCAVLPYTGVASISSSILEAIFNQTYQRIELLIVGRQLDDTLLSLANRLAEDSLVAFRHVETLHNSKSHIDYWHDGADETSADIIWFLSTDMVYAPNYAEKVLTSFADDSVQLAFGNTIISDGAAKEQSFEDVNEYRLYYNWSRHVVRLAYAWFCNPRSLGQEVEQHKSVMWRRSSLDAAHWQAAVMNEPFGELYLYLHMIAGGQAAWVRDAIALSVNVRKTSLTYSSDQALAGLQMFLSELRKVWGIAGVSLDRYRDLLLGPKGISHLSRQTSIDVSWCVDRLMSIERSKVHVLLLSHGIFAGGGENFPIQLANALRQQGLLVSMLIFNTKETNTEMRKTIDPGIAIYEAESVAEYGAEAFVRDGGFTIVNSHGVVGEKHFFDVWNVSLAVPYLATLHGSYENSSREDLSDELVERFASRVDHFAYTADKNLSRLARHGVSRDRLTKIINAMPIDVVDFPLSRTDMGIAKEAIVFTFVARGVREKGWAAAIDAFRTVRKANPGRSVHLCMVGEGVEAERVKSLHSSDPSITFLGYQLRIHGLYRISDVAVVPTRFSGESFPLCVIQAMQCGVPVIATGIGEIASMLVNERLHAGILIKNTQNDNRFTASLTKAMTIMLVEKKRREFGRNAKVISKRFDMTALASHYIDLYKSLQRSSKTP